MAWVLREITGSSAVGNLCAAPTASAGLSRSTEVFDVQPQCGTVSKSAQHLLQQCAKKAPHRPLASELLQHAWFRALGQAGTGMESLAAVTTLAHQICTVACTDSQIAKFESGQHHVAGTSGRASLHSHLLQHSHVSPCDNHHQIAACTQDTCYM